MGKKRPKKSSRGDRKKKDLGVTENKTKKQEKALEVTGEKKKL